MQDYEKIGAFYLGRMRDAAGQEGGLLLYDSKDLVTHAVCVGMTGSGKTGLCIGLLEEAAIDGVPAIAIDPKGDLGNLLLTFPELRAEDFQPWVNADEARRKGLSVEQYAAEQAALWRDGLAAWGQSGERIERLRQAAEFAVYTPGSEAGLPVSILASFAAPPPPVIEDGDLFRERIATTATSLLGLLKVAADPVTSREHILLSNLLEHFWTQGTDLDLGRLIQAIQRPPIDRVGVLELESFYPAKDRFELAMRLNNLLAAPGFDSWMRGEPLDPGRLLYTPTGKPRVAVLSIAHLSEAERMFFVSLLLNQTLSWMRTRPGTTSLRALLYMDEVFGYMPPVSEPPSKKPLLTLLKQARAYGLGVVLATQNPVDLDYKGLSNTGTWFIGRLQTERDKERLLDGLEGAAGGGLDRASVDRILSGLGKRIFLLHNVHEEEPVLFETRWVMSYLRGPLTREQIRRLSAGATEAQEAVASEQAVSPSAPRPAPPPPAPAPTSGSPRPLLPPEVPQVFLPVRGTAGAALVYRPALLGLGRVQFVERKTKNTLLRQDLALLLPLAEELLKVDWSEAREANVAEGDLETEPADGAAWWPVPAAAATPSSYGGWTSRLADTLYRSRTLDLFFSPTLGVTSEPGEDEREFRIRLGDLAREERDRQTEKLRERHASKASTLEERIRRAAQQVEKEKDQASGQKLQTAISIGATLLSAFTGRKRLSYSTLGRATTAMRGFGRTARDAEDVGRAEETVAALTRQLEQLNAELSAEIDKVEARFDPESEELEVRSIRPRRSDVEVRLVALAWTPYSQGPSGVLAPAWE